MTSISLGGTNRTDGSPKRPPWPPVEAPKVPPAGRLGRHHRRPRNRWQM